MTHFVSRRRFVLGSAAAVSLAGITRTTFSQPAVALKAPVVDSLVGQIHYGNPSIVRWLRIIPALQAGSALVLLLAALYIVRTREIGRAHV